MSMSTRNNHVHILVSIILVGMLLPVFVEAMTADAYLSLVATQRQQNNQRPLNTRETNATVTAWNSLSENQRLYVENRIAAIQANIALNGGNLPIGAAIGVIGNGYDQLPLNEQEILTKDAKDEAANPQKRSSASWCSGIVDCLMLIPSAIGKAIFTLLGGFLLELSRLILGIAGLLFNLLIEKTIIQFGTFYGDMKPAVEQAWTAFRDIANILIIGIFTFIAISIILGLKEYGQKKMIANVLIIAVMINFSLLFAKMIIDASNYTAAQIYTAAALGGTGGTTGGTAGAASTQTTYGIADQYMNLLGVGSVGGSFRVLWDVPGAWATLSHSIFMTMILLGAALVLFYGCFLLASRMIMLIFLMVTASIAFASYLIPKWAGSSYGWSAWWSSLLWCAALAPILMFFLWMTLNVSYALKGTSSPNLSAALSNPSVSTIGHLLNYLLILGLLFGTFKISSMAANKIGGFSMAAMVPGLGVAGLGRFAGFVGKNTVGRAAGSLSRRAGAAGEEHDAKGRWIKGALYGGLAKQLAKPEKRDFNMMNTKFGKDITGIAGLKGGWAGETKGKGIEGDDKAAAEMYAKRSEKAAEVLKKDMEKDGGAMLKEAARSIADLPENKEKAKNIRAQKEVAEKLLKESKEGRAENKANYEAALKNAETSKNAAETAIKRSEENMKTVVSQLERDKEYTHEGSESRRENESQIAAARAEHDGNQNSQNEKINAAKATVTRIQSLQKAEVDAEEGHKKTLTDIAKQNEEFEKKIQAEALSSMSAEKIAGKLVPARLTNIFRKDETNDRLTALTRKHIKETGEEKAIKNLIKKQQDEAGKKPEAEKPTGR